VRSSNFGVEKVAKAAQYLSGYHFKTDISSISFSRLLADIECGLTQLVESFFDLNKNQIDFFNISFH
jgi:hypothetical protein